MYRKRRAEETPQLPSKRARPAYFPQTPALSSNSSIYGKHTFATPRTPYTPYPLRPSDSPSNPFGRKRTQKLIQSLPPTSSFSKHIPLRFQFVRRAPSAPNISPRQGGVYRIVQVPLNYTLVHLKCLISFLFNTPASYHRSGAINGGNDDHLFEVKSKVMMYSPLYKPGQIKSGHTAVKLSNVRDPCRWRSQYGYGNDSDEEEFEESEENNEDGDKEGPEEEQDDWKWEDEEDYTLGHVWPGGLDIHRGLIYHHSPSTQVHISVNSTKLPRRRGSSKTPYVFSARGRVHLSPPPLPRPVFSRLQVTKSPTPRKFTLPKPSPPKHVLRSTKPRTSFPVEHELTDMDAEGDTDMEIETSNLSYPFYRPRSQGNVLVENSDDGREEEDEDEDEDEQEDAILEDPNAELNPNKWNEPAHAFGLYLLDYMGHPASDIDLIIQDDQPMVDPFDDDDDDDDIVPQNVESPEEFDEDKEALKLELMLSSSPGLTHRYSSSTSSQVPSSPFPLMSSPSHDFLFRSSPSPSLTGSIIPEIEIFNLKQHYPNTKYTNTPAPPKERTHRRRMERVQKRMDKMKRQGWLCARDESVSGGEEQKNEVDQLADDDDDGTEGKWVKPELTEGEVWDPFGDELEI